MRKMFAVALCLMWVLFLCAVMWNDAPMAYRIALLICTAVTGWVYMACESVVMRAHNLLQMAQMAVNEKTKPPEGVNDIT